LGYDYLSNTLRNQWTWQGVGYAMLRGAVEGIVTLKEGKWANKRWGKKLPRRPPRWMWT